MEETEHYVAWQDSYSVGIPVIDEQHKKLIELTNNLYGACVEGSDAAQAFFSTVINEVLAYVEFHFTAEEQIMTKVKYPQLLEHKRQHASFVKKVTEDVKKFEAGKPVPYVFVNYLRDWILSHIAVNDKAYSEHILHLKKSGTLSV